MKVKLIKTSKEDMNTIWLMQKEAFGGLLEKYQDHGISPASESYERIIEKYEMEGSFYYFISDSGVNVGGSCLNTETKAMPRRQSWKRKEYTEQITGALIRSFRKRAICTCMKSWAIIGQERSKR